MSPSWRLGQIGPLILTFNYTWLLLGAPALWSLALIQFAPYLSGAAAWALASGVVLLYAAGLVLAEVVRTGLAGCFTPRWPRSVQLFPFGAAEAYPPDVLTPGRAMLVAIAGPIVLALLATGYWGTAEALAAPGLLATVLRVLALTNGAVAILHLAPGLPLAGGWLLIALLKWFDKDTYGAIAIAHRLGLVAMLVLLAGGAQAVIGGGDWQLALGLLMIAWTLHEGDTLIEHSILTGEMLGQLTAREVMQEPVLTVTPDQFLSDVFWHQGKIDPDSVLPVQERQGHFVGLLPLSLSEDSLQGTWSQTRVATVMVPAARLPTVAPATPLPGVLAAFGQELRPASRSTVVEDGPALGIGYVPVVEDHHLRGVIGWNQVEEYERLAAHADVPEAAALAAVIAPTRRGMMWVGVILALLVGVMLLASFGNRVVSPTLVVVPVPTPPPNTSITFSAASPADGGFVPPGPTQIKTNITSSVPVLGVTMLLDDQPVAATLDQASPTQVSVSALVDLPTPGTHTVRLEVQTANGPPIQTEWTFQVVSDSLPRS